MVREHRHFDGLLTSHPRGLPVQLNYVFLGHLLIWGFTNLAPEWSRSFLPAKYVCFCLQASLLGVWVGAGRGLLIPRAVISMIVVKLVLNINRDEDFNRVAFLTLTAVATAIVVAEYFGFHFAFDDDDSEFPRPANVQFSLKQIFAVTTATAIVLALTRAFQSLLGQAVGMLAILLLLICAVTFVLCVTVLSVRHWLSRSIIAILTTMLAACFVSVNLIPFQPASSGFFVFSVVSSSAWLFAMFVTFAMLRTGGYRFGRFVADEPDS